VTTATVGSPPPGGQPRRPIHRWPERPFRLLRLPARPAQVAGADQLSARRRRDGRPLPGRGYRRSPVAGSEPVMRRERPA